mmetsp:Transcript_21005/g.46065  ORF Transcript_21005/g.46065 Transcript_21005/m.46065 type:complete len:283 (+) Transcript_21005:331-1179(+)
MLCANILLSTTQSHSTHLCYLCLPRLSYGVTNEAHKILSSSGFYPTHTRRRIVPAVSIGEQRIQPPLLYFFQGSSLRISGVTDSVLPSSPLDSSSLGASLGASALASAVMFIMEKMRSANSEEFSMMKPEVSMAVSNISCTCDVAMSLAAGPACALSALMMGLEGLISITLRPFMYSIALLSPMACARMMRSMLALQPNLEVARMQGESPRRWLTTTFSTCSPSTSFIHSVSTLYSSSVSSASFFSSSVVPSSSSSLDTSTSGLPSNSWRLVRAISSMGSVR